MRARPVVNALRPSGLWYGPIGTYEGLRLAAAVVPLTVIITSAAAMLRADLLSADQFTDLGLSVPYLAFYWSTHLGRLVTLFGVWSFVFLLDAFQTPASKLFQVDDFIAKYRTERELRRAGSVAAVLLLVAALVFFPFLHLSAPQLLNIALVLVAPALTIVGAFLATMPERAEAQVGRISKVRYASDKVFGIATAAQISIDARDEADNFTRYRTRVGLQSPEFTNYWRDGADSFGSWRGVDAIFSDLREYLGLPSVERLVRSDSATEAAEVLFRSILSERCTLISTSLEYPSVAEAARRVAYEHKSELAIVQIEGAGTTAFDRELVVDRVIEAVEKTAKRGRLPVVVMSHVHHDTGSILSVERLQGLRQSAKAVVIVDGAQAVGNIAVDKAIFEWVDAYFFSGHKWLGGAESTGWTFVGHNTVDQLGQPLAASLKGNAKFAGYYGDTRDDRDLSTANLAPIITLGVALNRELRAAGQSRVADHGRSLAVQFEEYARRMSCKTLMPVQSALVALRLPHGTSTSEVRATMAGYGYTVDELPGDRLLRIAFARNHDSLSVLNLAKALAQAIDQ